MLLWFQVGILVVALAAILSVAFYFHYTIVCKRPLNVGLVLVVLLKNTEERSDQHIIGVEFHG